MGAEFVATAGGWRDRQPVRLADRVAVGGETDHGTVVVARSYSSGQGHDDLRAGVGKDVPGAGSGSEGVVGRQLARQRRGPDFVCKGSVSDSLDRRPTTGNRQLPGPGPGPACR